MSNKADQPFFTLRVIVIGICLTVVMGAANAYLGMMAGMTVSASIPAAVVAMAVLNVLGKNQTQAGQVGETNLVQTIASAGESLAAGVIFTIPALYLMNHWQVFDYTWTTLIAMLGGLLGVLLIIPFRQRMVTDNTLPFPEGHATAKIIQLGSLEQEGGASGIKALLLGAAVAAIYKLAGSGFMLWQGAATVATKLGSGVWFIGTTLSPAMLGAGYIVGFNIALVIFIGGAIGWFVGIPLYGYLMADTAAYSSLLADQNARQVANTVWSTQIRYAGVGMMLVGGIYTLIKMLLHWGRRRAPTIQPMTGLPHQQDLSPNLRRGLLLILLAAVWGVYFVLLDDWVNTTLVTIVMAFAASIFTVVAGYMAGLVGSSHNPVSGMTISTIVLTCILLLALGIPGDTGTVIAIMVAGVVCCAAAIGGDTVQDLKAGYLLKTQPRLQQIAQGIGVFFAAIAMAPVLNLLLEVYGIGNPTGDPNSTALAAPQANLMKSVVEAIFGETLPWNLLVIGAVLGLMAIALDSYLEKKQASFRIPILALALGLYLPLELATIGLIGGVVSLLVTRGIKAPSANNTGVLVAAGMITGEALMAILLAVPILITEKKTVLAGLLQDKPQFLLGPQGLILILLIALMLYGFAKRQGNS